MKRRTPFVQSQDEEKNFVPLTETEGNAFLTYYRGLPEKTPDTLRLFVRKNTYTAYEEDAEFVADEFYHSRTVIKTLELAKKTSAASKAVSKQPSMGPSFVNLAQRFAETVVSVAINEKKMKVEIHSLGDDRRWTLYRKGSPGNVQQLEELLFARSDVQESPIMMALTWSTQGGQRVLGAAFCDTLMKKLVVSEFLDSESFSNLESLIVQIGAKECYLPMYNAKDPDFDKILAIMQRCDVVEAQRKNSDFDSKSIEQDLRTLLGKHFVDAHAELELKQAMSATACIIAGLELLSQDANLGSFRISHYDLRQFMRLDAAAAQALNLIPNSREGNQQYNLFALLNRCKTPMGHRKLMLWIKQPLVSAEAIKCRHDIVEAFTTDVAMLADIRGTGLRGIGDIERITKKIQRRKSSLQDVILLYAFVQKLPQISGFLSRYCDDQHRGLLEELFIQKILAMQLNMTKFMSLVEQFVDLEAAEQGEYQINASFDESLGEIDAQKKKLKADMKKREYEVKVALKSPDHFALEYDKVHGWVYRVTKKEEKILETKENKTRFNILANVKSGIKFQDAHLKAHSDEYADLVQTYTESCKVVMEGLHQTLLSFVNMFELAHDLVAEIDVLASFAEVSHSALKPFVRPVMHEPGTGNTVLLQSRHPILESAPDIKFVPNDCKMVRGSSSFIIITGPNMGGKSTYIRQVGLIVLMAQIGCFVPCDEGTEICIADAILARIGAGDSQLRGVSTFMAEMLETATILKTATQHSLVIIDELGRGTSTYDGFGLAWAISEYLAGKIGCFCLFATHFHELTQLSEEMEGVKNHHVSAVVTPQDGLVLQYVIADGPSDQSFGIHVAKLAKFPDSVIQVATQKAAELESFDQSTRQLIGGQASSNAMEVDESQADAFISNILRQFSDLPIDSMSPAQIQEALDKIKQQVDASDIPLVKHLLAAELS
jgi:DNA mismatch repair protein MSH2